MLEDNFEIPPPPPFASSSSIKLPRTKSQRETYKQVIIVLDQAPLEIVKIGKNKDESAYHLLSSDEHQSTLRKNGRDISEYRPDITHQCLLTLLDSPLNKAGRLKVFIRTFKGVLIEINPQTRIPRTFNRFSGLMVQLLHKLSIKATGSSEKLLNVIKNPITSHLPTGARRFGLSQDAPIVKFNDWIKNKFPSSSSSTSSSSSSLSLQSQSESNSPSLIPSSSLSKDTQSIVFFIGAMSHGDDKFKDVEEMIGISEYPLSASVACSRICHSFEELWNIV